MRAIRAVFAVGIGIAGLCLLVKYGGDSGSGGGSSSGGGRKDFESQAAPRPDPRQHLEPGPIDAGLPHQPVEQFWPKSEDENVTLASAAYMRDETYKHYQLLVEQRASIAEQQQAWANYTYWNSTYEWKRARELQRQPPR